MTEERKPCPFCGGKAKVVWMPYIGAEGIGLVVECNQCWAQTGYYDTREEAIDAWNRRVERLERENAKLRAREQDASAPANKTPPRARTRRVLVLDDATDGATGSCRCGACGCSIEPSDDFCRRCGAEMEG